MARLTICLLCNFNEKSLMKKQNQVLLALDDELDEMANQNGEK